MNNEPLTTHTDIIWQQYQFAFNETIAIDSAFSNLVKDKLDSLGLNNENAEIRFEEAQGQPGLYNIYVLHRVTDEPVKTSPTISQPLFDLVTGSASPEGIIPAGQPQVETVSFKGVVRNPPPSSDPLP